MLFFRSVVVTLGQGEPLARERVVWTADVPLTMGQLQGRRDTFWDTAPMYDGRREIWDALKAAVEAAEEEDYDLAQAILSGASITLPTGGLSHMYSRVGPLVFCQWLYMNICTVKHTCPHTQTHTHTHRATW